MKKVGIVVFLVVIYTGAIAQSRMDSLNKAFRFADTLFVVGTHDYQVIDFVYPDSIQALAVKMNNSLSQNREWYFDYMKKYYVPGQGLPYDPRMGITESEYNIFKHIDTFSTHIKTLEKGSVIITKSAGRLKFKSLGESHLLDFLTIDVGLKQTILNYDTIPFSGELNVNNPHRMGPWHGFSWLKEETDNPEVKNIDDITSKVINLIFGCTISGQHFIRIKFQQVKDGKPLANGDVLFFIG